MRAENRSSTTWRPLLLLASALALAACSLPTGGGGAIPAAESGTPRRAVPEFARLNELLVDLVERLRPALVQIRAEAGPAQEARPGAAGFIVDPSGIVVTVGHVLSSGGRLEVELSDGRRVPGRVVGRDARTDLAAVRIESTPDLPVLRLGDSDRVRPGELVLALGHPYGLPQAVSLGVVSWVGAPPTGGPPGFDFIHTDASVNPGNSGGPLVNLAGEVVGVNTWAARKGSMGIAVPSTLLKLVLPQLMADGRVEWGWLGVRIAGVGPRDLARLGLREARGALIRDVMRGGPAEGAGLHADDVVVAVDGRAVDHPRDLQRLIMATQAGRRVRIVLLREGNRTEVDVTLARYPEAEGTPDRGEGSASFRVHGHRAHGSF